MSNETIERHHVIITSISLLLGFAGLFASVYFGISSHNNTIAAQNDAAVSSNKISKLQYQIEKGSTDREELSKSHADQVILQKKNTMEILSAFSEDKKQTFHFFNQIISNQQIADRKNDIFIEFTKNQQQINAATIEAIDDIKTDDMYLEPYNEELDFMVDKVLQDNETTKKKMQEILTLLETQQPTQEPVIVTPKEPVKKPVKVISRQRVKRRIKAPAREPIEAIVQEPSKAPQTLSEAQQKEHTPPFIPVLPEPKETPGQISTVTGSMGLDDRSEEPAPFLIRVTPVQ